MSRWTTTGTGSDGHRWSTTIDGRQIAWTGLQTGPLTLSRARVEAICQELLDCSTDRLTARSERILRPALGEAARRPALLLHSTTPDLKTYDGDLDALVLGHRGGDFTTYKEARSVYLGGPDDIAIGRTDAWRAAVEALGARSIRLEDVDHYYLSHALLHLAVTHGEHRHRSMDRMVACLRERPRVVRLYAFELEMQIFLLWLARTAGVDELAVEANRPALSAAWNRKRVLHPTVERAGSLDGLLDLSPAERLVVEGRHCELALDMGIEVPRIPGYTIERDGRSADEMSRQVVLAAQWLGERHGLTTGCLKASESGDGARITPGLSLADHDQLAELARRAHVYGDDYVLEAHVDYGSATLAGQTLPTALSAHIRGGEVASGTTMQFMEGTSWKGNVLVDEDSLDTFSVPTDHYRRLRSFLGDFHGAFRDRAPGLVLAGIDFAIGTVGGHYGSRPLLGVQDLNVSFTGAECLRAFLDKVRRERGDAAQPVGVTRIYRPVATADHHAFLEITRAFVDDRVVADTVAAIPGRWGMVGITGDDAEDAIGNLNRLERALRTAGLIAA
ncbi:MAG: hypothetical protein AAGE94_16855 [Acidobacteriota bacterium]